MSRRWLFADQLGPHFLDDDVDEVLLVESRDVLSRKRFHRAKAHLVLSALRHRAAELQSGADSGSGPAVRLVRSRTYREALDAAGGGWEVVHPTSREALALVERLPQVARVLPWRGFTCSAADFEAWRAGRRRRLLLEDFVREQRHRLGLLMDGDEPLGGRWNFDADNREPAPRGGLGLPPAWQPVEDDIDAQVRDDLDRWERDGDVRFVGRDGPRRFAVTRTEAMAALAHFLAHRLPLFGRYEDAMLVDDPVLAHSMLSAPLNLGLLDPLECAEAAQAEHAAGRAPLAAVEGFVRQLVGWREYVWQLSWALPASYAASNVLDAHVPLPAWFVELDADAVSARCLSTTLAAVRDTGWTHHIPRLMVLGGYALQQGWDPQELTDWFHRSFVDGYSWVMAPNVVGMSQHADGGLMATKPYLSGGAYLHRMGDACRACPFDPKHRTGPRACPYTAGYWAFLHQHRERFARNPRMAQAVRGLDRLADLGVLLADAASRDPQAAP